MASVSPSVYYYFLIFNFFFLFSKKEMKKEKKKERKTKSLGLIISNLKKNKINKFRKGEN